MARQVEFTLFPGGQLSVFMSQAYEVLGYGGRGSGKSYVACLKGYQHALIPGNLVVFCRQTRTDLKNTTLRTLLEGLNPIIPRGTYDHNRSESHIWIHGGGEIIYFGFDDESRLGSLEPGCIVVDEAIQIDADEYLMLIGGLRGSADPNPQMILATNPAPRSHFLYDRFKPDHPELRNPQRDAIFVPTWENPHLPEKYLRTLYEMPTHYKRRYYDGAWGAFEGLIWSNFDPKVHVKRRKASEFHRFFCPADAGFTNPYAFLVIGEDNQGAFHVFEEVYQSGMLQQEQVARSRKLAAEYGELDALYIDPSAAGLISAFRDADEPAMKANNDVLDGIAKVQARLGVNKKLKRPMLTISPECKKLIGEIEAYVWAKDSGKDKPTKKNDHACDALRYGIASEDHVPTQFHVGEDEMDPLKPPPRLKIDDPNEWDHLSEADAMSSEYEHLWEGAGFSERMMV